MAWKQPRTLEPDKLSQNPRKANFITFKDKYVLSDGNRSLEIYLTQGRQPQRIHLLRLPSQGKNPHRGR